MTPEPKPASQFPNKFTPTTRIVMSAMMHARPWGTLKAHPDVSRAGREAFVAVAADRLDEQARTGNGAGAIDNTYNAHHLLVLEGLEAVRKRPGMYIGSTDGRGLTHCLWEIIDNAVDEALGGFCTHVDVTLHADGSAEVRDDGRGIPVDKEPKTGLSGVEVVFTKLHAGGKFGGGSYVATGGLHGVGASVVNALSARLDIEVDRSPATQAMSFHRGAPGLFAGDGPEAPFTPQSGLHKGGRVSEGRHRHPDPVLARPPDLHQGRDVHVRRADQPGPPDLVHRARPRAGDP